ncbi:alpha-tectorin-like [Pelobates cultripes]|uniref:Alpha-tectorin-like n=1 Tax=Pelobates cultripes TaxID=61616 RepID=A0AAD1T2Q8_PELCU|nr:alpha-tectorin-like [Pelobates cultripes]
MKAVGNLLLALVLISTLGQGLSESESLLYPYGPSEGDQTTPVEDDGASAEIPISVPFKFFSKEYNSLFVNNNGVISFKTAVSQYTPDAFPLTNGQTFVTPFWGDVDNRLAGKVYYRQSTKPDLLKSITDDMEKHLPGQHFTATWAFIATWDKVAYYASESEKVNTFQAALTTDGLRFFIILNYGDIQWTTGKASGGNPLTGLGGIPAQAGFNSGDETHYFNIPGSRTGEILNIKSTSNVNYPGRWIFRVDDFQVPGGCLFKSSFAKEGEEFWTDSTCTTKCLCKANGDVPCAYESCSASAACVPSGSFYKCKEKEKICF